MKFGQFGAVVSVNYSSRPIESENYQGSTNYVITPNSNPIPDQNGLRAYNLVRTRLGVVGNFDWHPSDDAKIYLRTSYSKFTDHETRDQNRTASEKGITPTSLTTGSFTSARKKSSSIEIAKSGWAASAWRYPMLRR